MSIEWREEESLEDVRVGDIYQLAGVTLIRLANGGEMMRGTYRSFNISEGVEMPEIPLQDVNWSLSVIIARKAVFY